MHKKSRSYKKTEKGVSGLLGLFLTECFLGLDEMGDIFVKSLGV